MDYTGKPMMIGAIYAENKDSYECTMKKAYKRLFIVSRIYQTKAEKLDSYILPGSPGSATCTGKYNTEKIIDLKLEANKATPYILTIRGLKTDIEQQNRATLLASCPSIY